MKVYVIQVQGPLNLWRKQGIIQVTMPPKKAPAAASKKTEQKKKEKVIEVSSLYFHIII